MNIGARVKFSEEYIKLNGGIKNQHTPIEKRRGTVIKFSGKNDLYTHVKWDGFKTVTKYHCNYIINI